MLGYQLEGPKCAARQCGNNAGKVAENRHSQLLLTSPNIRCITDSCHSWCSYDTFSCTFHAFLPIPTPLHLIKIQFDLYSTKSQQSTQGALYYKVQQYIQKKLLEGTILTLCNYLTKTVCTTFGDIQLCTEK